MEQYGGQIERINTTATSGGTVTLVNTSPQLQVFTGTMNETVVLPVATTYTAAGAKFEFYNLSSGSISVQYQDATALQTIPANSTLIIKLRNNGTANGLWTTLTNSTVPSVNAPTIQKFLSGSGTYTLPSGPTPLYIKVRMVGGGGGGGGGTSSGGNGGTGGSTTFGVMTAGGASGGNGSATAPGGGSGGTASLGSGPVGVALSGGNGTAGPPAVNFSGIPGPGTPFGGGGAGSISQSSSTTPAPSNTGSGGAGGPGDNTAGGPGGSGGAGGYVEAIITSPASTYSYAVGAGGSAGGGPFPGGTGGSGIIVVEEFYQ